MLKTMLFFVHPIRNAHSISYCEIVKFGEKDGMANSSVL
jgi:hypothetical protein